MEYDDVDIQVRERDGRRMYELDGYFRPHPESKASEHRRQIIADLTEDQARALYADLEEKLSE